MAIIIGAERTEEREHVLKEAEVDLPHPASVPAQHRLIDRAQITSLLSHESALVRTFALEQIARRDDEAWDEELIRLVDDEDHTVAAEAISLLGHREAKEAVEPMLARFAEAKGDVAAAAASALGQLAPDRLLEALKQRGRLDEEAYAATATSLAIIGSQEVIEFLRKALNRAGALSPERRGTLYGAALLCGDRELSARVIGLAITDSQEEEPEGSAFPTRAALGALAGLPISMTSRSSGLELFDQCRELLADIVVPLLEEEQRKALEEALKLKRPGQTLEALRPVLEMSIEKRADASDDEKKDVVEELGTMPERRRGFLEALLARADAIEKLDLSAAALFVASAVKAASVLVAGGADEVSSDALKALAKALEGELPAEKLASMSLEQLTELFQAKSPRDMRRVLAVITRESFHRSRTLARFARAAILGGHGKALLETMGDIKEVGIQNPILDAFSNCPEQAEEAVVEIFSERPLQEPVIPYALAVAEEIRTERVGLAIARRFYDLREHGRGAVARTLLRVGDPRFIPLLESRAYPDEPEEVAWAALSLAHGAPTEGRLREALDRSMRGREEGPEGRMVRLPLRCKRCKETLGYGFRRVYLDVEAKDKWADPAFVGEVKCKACGFDDEPFEPTDAAAQILTSHLMEFLSAARMGRMVDRPLVTPAQTAIGGRRVGFAAALRELNKDVAASPDAIRPRLHRARLLLMLERPGVEEDLDKLLALDPESIEALTLLASVKLRKDDNEGAAKDVIRALRRLDEAEEPRFYDVGDVSSFRDSLEDLLIELRARGVSVPEEIDLRRAEARVQARAQEILRMEEERRAAMEGPPPAQPPEERALDPAQVGKVGRNDPCPCGSGKKYKKCHGSR